MSNLRKKTDLYIEPVKLIKGNNSYDVKYKIYWCDYCGTLFDGKLCFKPDCVDNPILGKKIDDKLGW